MRVTAVRAGTALGARATARASGRRARGTGIGMMRHGAGREGAGPSERRAGEAVGVLDESR